MSTFRQQLQAVQPALQTMTVASLSAMTADQLDTLGERGETTLIRDAVYSENMSIPTLVGGWEAVYSGKRAPGARGRIVLIPRHPHTQRLWNKGQMSVARQYGLSDMQAALWISSRQRSKLDLLELLAYALQHDAVIESYLAWSPEFTSEEFQKWSARSGIRDHLNPVRRGMLVSLIREQLNPPPELVSMAERLLNPQPRHEPRVQRPARPVPAPDAEPAVPKMKPLTDAQLRRREKKRNRRDTWRAKRRDGAPAVASQLQDDVSAHNAAQQAYAAAQVDDLDLTAVDTTGMSLILDAIESAPACNTLTVDDISNITLDVDTVINVVAANTN